MGLTTLVMSSFVYAMLVVGFVARTRGFGTAFIITAAAFLIAAARWIFIPETKGRQLA